MIRLGSKTHQERSVSGTRSALSATLSLLLVATLSGSITLFGSAVANPAFAQHEGAVGSAPPPPPGPGELIVQIINQDAAGSVSGISVALYALAPDGTPGLTDSETDAQGTATFSGISNDPNIVYLVGAQYKDIPFGERAAFQPGETSARVEVKVSSPTSNLSGISLDEIRSRVDWMGDRIVLTEVVRLTNPGDRVIQLSEAASGTAIFERPLPKGAKDFSAGPNSLGDGLTAEDGTVRFSGPLYPGDQRVEYRYSLPIASDRRALQLPIEMKEAVGRVVVVAGTDGLEAAGPELIPSREVPSESGQRLSSWARTALPAGQVLQVALRLPESRFDANLLSIPRGDVWVDFDDTRMSANVDLQISVEPGPPVSGTSEAPLFHVTLPNGASLEGVSPDAESMGLIPTGDGGFDVIGPIGPGDHSLGFAYRIPSRPEGVQIDMRFPREIATLNVLIADTGLALESGRLHRRRPFRNGTRNFLHREAYNVSPDETVDLSLEPLRATGIPKQASLGLTLVAVAGAALFLIAPLRKSPTRTVTESPGQAALRGVQEAREAVYSSISDLDHDFETGKLEAEDHANMRAELLGEAVELLRQERSLGASSPEAGGPPNVAAAATGAAAAQPQTPPATGRFCPGCGETVNAGWKFCTHCGGSLNPSADTPT